MPNTAASEDAGSSKIGSTEFAYALSFRTISIVKLTYSFGDSIKPTIS